jgi:hypothetical protein
MFRLTIDLPPATTATAHPSREAARDELLRFFAETGQAFRVTEADWRHTSYEIVATKENQLVLGRAAIDEVCACEHAYSEHDEIGCTVTVLKQRPLTDCECRGYEPDSGDPTLFDVETCLTAGPPRPT